MKRYGQRCPVARALDVVGERWSLLVVRELALGPRRYRDLLDGLPGIPTNLLAGRLRELQAAGLVSKRTLARPASVTVYELTEAGRALRPVLDELRDWGNRYGRAPSDTDTVRPAWALLSTQGRATQIPDGRRCELRVGTELFQLGGMDSRLVVRGGPPVAAPDAIVTMTEDALYRLVLGRSSPTAAAEESTVNGEAAVAHAALESLNGVLSSPERE